MKKYVVTAAALMLGTSALAWAPAEEAHIGAMQAGTWISEMSAGKTPQSFAAFDDKGAMKAQTAAYDASPAATSDDGKKALAGLDESLVETAAAEGFKDTADAAAGKPAVETASLDGKTEIATSGTEAGMGGPIEEAQGYPACRPGPGDDNCIQLYERGVTQALAGWKGSDSGVAMGGPFEPVADGSKDRPPASDDHAAMGHGSAMPADTADTATAKPEATAEMTGDAETAVAAKPAATETPATPGVGGPVEARTDYPPCRPGRGDDNCIQLYERGVSGRKD
ncbi:MAG TPA: hypothetical protein VF603_16540 [Allosphingosinicella sp.]